MIRKTKQRQQKIIIKGKLDIRKQQQIISLIEDTFSLKVIWKASKDQEKEKQSEIRNVIPCLMNKFDQYLQQNNIYLNQQIQDIKQPYKLGHLKAIFNNSTFKDIQNHWITYLDEESEKNIEEDKKITQKNIYKFGKDLLLKQSRLSYQQNNAEPFKNFLTTSKYTLIQSEEYTDNTQEYQFYSR